MERLVQLKQRLEKINEARRLNKLLREKKLVRIQEINTLLDVYNPSKANSQSQGVTTTHIKIAGLSDDDISYLIRSFWGRPFQNGAQIDNANAEENQNEIQNVFRQFTPEEKRLICINSHLSPIQKLSIVQNINPNHTLSSVMKADFLPINLPLSFYDKVRILIFSLAYGPNVSVDTFFPNLGSRRVLTFINSLKSLKEPNLSQEASERIITALNEAISILSK